MPRIGIIGGSGLYQIDGLDQLREVRMQTPFGDPSDASHPRPPRGPGSRLFAAPRPRSPHSADQGEQPRQHLGDEVTGCSLDHLGVGRGLAQART